MDGVGSKIERIRSQISALETVLKGLRRQLADAESHAIAQGKGDHTATTRTFGEKYPNGLKSCRISNCTDSEDSENSDDTSSPSSSHSWPMPLDEYRRYGRQMILPQIGLKGQLSLKSARVLVVGLGGLGCPAAMYLAGAGVGTLGLIDGDDVELSNLHRQCLHTTGRVGWYKVNSAVETLKEINPTLNYTTYPYPLTAQNALKSIEKNYDLILDCTDHPTSRYLISDAAILAGIPLISASALKAEGQLLVLNYPVIAPTERHSDRGHCYRCVFPRPPPPESVESCGEGGILGPVVGVMGVLMASEAIKILTVTGTPHPPPRTMLLYSAYSDTPFRTVRIQGKKSHCPSCSEFPTITRHSLKDGSMDYMAFCGFRQSHIGDPVPRMSLDDFQEYRATKRQPDQPVLIDVRNETEFNICHLPYAINIPISNLQQNPDILRPWLLKSKVKGDILVFICRYGNDSQEAVKIGRKFVEESPDLGPDHELRDVTGGLRAWKEEIDPGFPEY